MDSLRKKTYQPQRQMGEIAEKKQLPRQTETVDPQSKTRLPQRQFLKRERITTQTRSKKRSLLKKSFFYIAIIALFLAASYVGFILWKTHSISNRINIESNGGKSFMNDMGTMLSSLAKPQNKELKGEADGRINILLLGAAGENKPGKNLTDTVMIMSIDTVSKRLALMSLPRDLYVNIPQDGRMTKLNSIYQYGLSSEKGIEPIKNTVAEITGLPIHYYSVVNFDAFTDIIDQIGGINVTVERDILDTRYPGPNYSYETFEISKGFHTLDGATALKYVRERHADPEGDFGRAKRQQQVIQAVKNKLFSAQTILNILTLNSILDIVGENVKTDIDLEELESFISLSRIVDTQNINNVVVDAWKKDSLLKVSHVMVGDIRAFVLVPRLGNFSQIREVAENIFDNDALKKRRAQIAAESPTITIINRSKDNSIAYKVQELLTNSLSMKEVRIVYKKDLAELSATLVQDNTHGEKLFSLDELVKKIPARIATPDKIIGVQNIAEEPLQDEQAQNSSVSDFVIHVGNDLVETYQYEEDSVEEMEKAGGEHDYVDLLN